MTKVSGLDSTDFQSKRGMSVAPQTRTNNMPCGLGAMPSAPGCKYAPSIASVLAACAEPYAVIICAGGLGQKQLNATPLLQISRSAWSAE